MGRMYSDEIVEMADRNSRNFGDKLFEVNRDRKFKERQADQQSRQAELDEMTKYAQLSELGYQVPQMDRFGMTRDPNFVSKSELERKKLERELKSYDEPLPKGYTRLPGGKTVRDQDYFNPDVVAQKEAAKIRGQMQGFGQPPQFGQSSNQSSPTMNADSQKFGVPGFGMKSMKIGPYTYENLDFETQQTLAKEKAKGQAKRESQAAESTRNFQKIANLMSRTVAQKKAQIDETGGAGLIKGTVGKLGAAARIPGYEATGAYQGQRLETAMALNSLLTGQNRVIEGVLKKIQGTLPDELDPEGYSATKISQSLYNSFGLLKAMQRAGITKDVLDQMSDEELADPNSEINQVIKSLNVEPLSPDEMKQFEPFIQQVLNTPAQQKMQFGQPTEESSAMFAVNPQTSQRIKSLDGGQTWQPA